MVKAKAKKKTEKPEIVASSRPMPRRSRRCACRVVSSGSPVVVSTMVRGGFAALMSPFGVMMYDVFPQRTP